MCVRTGQRMFRSPCSSRGSRGATAAGGRFGGVHEACMWEGAKVAQGQDVCTEVMGRINLGACLMERRFVLTPRWRDGLARLCYYAPILMH